MKKVLIFLCVIIALGCTDNDLNSGQPRSEEYIVFGDYYGMCAGNCVRMYLLNKNSLYEDSEKTYPISPGVYLGKFSIDRSDKFNDVKEILTSIPGALLKSEDIVLGCPDCSDGGGLYVETKIDGHVKYWFIDKQRVPAGLEQFVMLLNQKLALLEN